MTVQEAKERVIARAEAELGYIEKASNSQLDDKTANAGNRNFTKYGRDLDNLNVYNGKKNGYDWCDQFADWCFIMEFGKQLGLEMICQPDRSYGAGVNSSAKYYKQAGRLDKNPEVGDQVYFIGSDGLYYHTGIVVKVTDTTVTTIEGNAGTGSTRVVETTYSRSNKRLGAYGHPRWYLAADVPDDEASDATDKTPAAPDPVTPVTPDKPTAALKVGDIVILDPNATVYGKDYKFSSWVYTKGLYVRSINGNKVQISVTPTGAITGSVDIKYLTLKDETKVTEPEPTPAPAPVVTNDFKVGDVVSLDPDALVYGKTYKFSSWVYKSKLYVRKIEGDRVWISTMKVGPITGSTYKKYIKKQ